MSLATTENLTKDSCPLHTTFNITAHCGPVTLLMVALSTDMSNASEPENIADCCSGFRKILIKKQDAHSVRECACGQYLFFPVLDFIFYFSLKQCQCSSHNCILYAFSTKRGR